MPSTAGCCQHIKGIHPALTCVPAADLRLVADGGHERPAARALAVGLVEVNVEATFPVADLVVVVELSRMFGLSVMAAQSIRINEERARWEKL